MTCINCGKCVQTECDHGFYGSACNLTCSAQCRHCESCTCATCDFTSGYCLHGCNVGWYGKLCQQKCPENCSVQNSLSGKCDQGSGTCENGCVDGFFGSRCNGMCGIKCGNMLCNQTTGDCMTGCVQGFKGTMCNEQIGLSKDNPVAGAVGGAVVIILWGAIVIILICFIRRRRQKEYDAFARSRSRHSSRGSSRRQLQRQQSCSSNSMPSPLKDADQCYEVVIPDLQPHRGSCESRRLYYVRSYSDETPVFHYCAQHEEMDLRSSFRNKCSSVGNRKQLDMLTDDVRRSRVPITPVSSDNEADSPSEMTDMLNFKQPKHHEFTVI